MTDVADDYRLLREDVGAVWLRRDVVRVVGPDAQSYLNGQLSQDIMNVDVGSTTWSWLLQPHGKVDALVRLTRVETDTYVLDVDAGFAHSVVERLRRFLVRTKADVEQLNWKSLALRGPRSHQVGEMTSGDMRVDADWGGMAGVDLMGADIGGPSDVRICNPEAYEVLRIEAGVPVMGRELDERTIPAEAGINDRTISFTKGCYTGQELVARIDSRGGNVPRHLRGIVVDADELPELGSKIFAKNGRVSSTKPLGLLSSVALSPRFKRPVGLAMIRRDAVVPGEAVMMTDDHAVSCRIEQLPLT